MPIKERRNLSSINFLLMGSLAGGSKAAQGYHIGCVFFAVRRDRLISVESIRDCAWPRTETILVANTKMIQADCKSFILILFLVFMPTILSPKSFYQLRL